MVRAALRHDFIGWQVQAVGLGIFLQGAFVVLTAPGGQPLILLKQRADHPANRLVASVHIDGGEHSLHGVGQNAGLLAAAGLLLAMAHQQISAQVQRAGNHTERAFAHQRGAAGGQFALVQVGVFLVQHVADAKLQHRVAQKFQALVVRQLCGGMRQRQAQVGRVPEGIAQGLLQTLHRSALLFFGMAAPPTGVPLGAPECRGVTGASRCSLPHRQRF